MFLLLEEIFLQSSGSVVDSSTYSSELGSIIVSLPRRNRLATFLAPLKTLEFRTPTKHSFNFEREQLSKNTTDAAALFLICDSREDVATL